MRWICGLWWFACGLPAVAEDYEVKAIPADLRKDFRLDEFYTKCVVSKGFPVVSSAKVSDHALKEAAYLIDRMLAGRDDVRKALVKHKVRFGVLATNEFTTDMPEHKNLKPKLYWDKRARGLGATVQVPLVSCGEENLLNLRGDPYSTENILIHEFAHAIHDVGLKEVDKEFDPKLRQLFEEAKKQGLWKNTYAMTNHHEYWAEVVQSWFDCNRPKDAQHNGITTREKLKEYDPRIAKLLAEVFKDNDYRYVRTDRRPELGHLQGFDRKKAPTFVWPKELLEANEKNLGNGTIRGKAGDSDIVITTKAKFAGAISSLTWKGKEFLDSADHGRLLQSASNFDTGKKFIPETFNPTEGGSRLDGAGDRSTSKLFRYDAIGSRLTSITQMAFWLASGEKTPSGDAAYNTEKLSKHDLSKRVQIGYEDWPHAIEYETTFIVPEGEGHKFAQFEALTGYMPAEFNRFYILVDRELKPLDDGPGEQPHPIVFATENGSHAMGIFSPDQPSKGFENAGYGRFRFKEEKVVKWNCVFRLRNEKGIASDRYTYRIFVVVGSLEEVRKTMVGIRSK